MEMVALTPCTATPLDVYCCCLPAAACCRFLPQAREARGLALAPDRMSTGERALVGAVLGAPVTQVGRPVGHPGGAVAVVAVAVIAVAVKERGRVLITGASIAEGAAGPTRFS